MRYRRNFVAGGCYFFTVVTEGRRPILTRADSIDVLRGAFGSVRAKHPFWTEAAVILPDRLHCVWTLPPGDADFATRWRLINTWFTRPCESALLSRVTAGRSARREQGIWQRRYWEHTLRNAEGFVRHVEYIHYNPVKHGYAPRPLDWPYSSFHRYVRAGDCPSDWAGVSGAFDGVGHESGVGNVGRHGDLTNKKGHRKGGLSCLLVEAARNIRPSALPLRGHRSFAPAFRSLRSLSNPASPQNRLRRFIGYSLNS